MFSGFPETALEFYDGLTADNTKAYWSDHKAVYDECVAAPMRELLAALEPEFGAAKFFRPYRDVRFSKDKTPYKDHAAAVVENGDSGALYVQLGAEGLFLGGGYWHTATDQAQRLRAAIADARTGSGLATLLDGLTGEGFQVQGDRLKRLPKPYEAQHPRADLLHHKALSVGLDLEPEPWLHEPVCLDRIVAAWRAVGPVNAWLKANVGASRTPARPRGG